MKNNLFIIYFALLFGALVEEHYSLNNDMNFADKLCFSESMIQNSSAFNLHSAIQESLLDRESPEYILQS